MFLTLMLDEPHDGGVDPAAGRTGVEAVFGDGVGGEVE